MEFELWLTDHTGARIPIRNSTGEKTALLDTVMGFTATRVANQIGWLQLDLPAGMDVYSLDPERFADRMVQVLYRPTGGGLRLFRTYFVRKMRLETVGGKERDYIAGPGGIHGKRRGSENRPCR